MIFISMVVFFLRLGSISVYQVAEARNAECAREMLAGESRIVPRFNGQLRTDKPALEYYAMMVAYRLGGVNEGSARFFSALCGLLLVVFTFLVAYRHLGRNTAWWSAMGLLASMHLVVQFRLATPDPYLVLFDTVALYCFIEGWVSASLPGGRPWRWYASMYVLLGLAMWAKGPVGLLLPALILFVFVLVKKRLDWKTIRSLRPWWGLLIALLFSAPWYIMVHLKTGGVWTRSFFLDHNIHRFDGVMGGHGGIFLITFLFVAGGMLPFSVFIIHTMGYVWKRKGHNDLLLFSLIAFWCVVIFYAASRTKLINYTVPCYPFLAIMTGAFLAHIIRSKSPPKGLIISFLFLGLVGLAMPTGIYFWTKSAPGLRGLGWIFVFFILYPVGTWIAFALKVRKKLPESLSIIAATFVIGTMLVFAAPYPLLDAQTPMRKAQSLFYPGRPVAVYKSFNDAFVFYIRHPVPVLKDTLAVRGFLDQHPGSLIISDAKNQDTLEKMSGMKIIRKDHEVFNSHTSIIYRDEDLIPGIRSENE